MGLPKEPKKPTNDKKTVESKESGLFKIPKNPPPGRAAPFNSRSNSPQVINRNNCS